MKLGFIGGCGHLMLRRMFETEPALIDSFAVAGDGIEDARAKNLLQRFPGGQWFDDPHEMLAKFRPDLVNIGPVYGCNGRWTIAVLEAGIPAVCEKPVAVTRDELAGIRRILETRGGHLFTEFAFRCHGTFRAAKECIAAGRIGEVALIVGQKSYRFGAARPAWYADRNLYPGTVMWVASHFIDAAWFCGGRRFVSVAGIQGNVSKPDYGSMEDHTVSVFGLDNGGSCVIHADFLRPGTAPTHSDDRMRFAGSKGVIVIDRGTAELISEDEGAVLLPHEHLDVEFYAEVLAALDGKPSILSTDDSLYLAEVLLAAREAGDSGTAQLVPPAR